MKSETARNKHSIFIPYMTYLYQVLVGVGIWYGTSRDSKGSLSDLETEHTNGFKAKASHTQGTKGPETKDANCKGYIESDSFNRRVSPFRRFAKK